MRLRLRGGAAAGDTVSQPDTTMPWTYAVLKRALDVSAGAVGLVAVSPGLAAIALAIRWSSDGPVLFAQERVGRHGRPFRLLKFRTMVAAAPGRGPAVTAGGDPRVTRVGRVLRRHKLDELPQLLNVVRGQMSLVGPRPEVLKYVQAYPEAYREVLSVKPGITDFAAIEFRNEEEILGRSEDPERCYIDEVLPAKIALYRKYLECRSMRTDLEILLRTVRVVLVPSTPNVK